MTSPHHHRPSESVYQFFDEHLFPIDRDPKYYEGINTFWSYVASLKRPTQYFIRIDNDRTYVTPLWDDDFHIVLNAAPKSFAESMTFGVVQI